MYQFIRKKLGMEFLILQKRYSKSNNNRTKSYDNSDLSQ